jgi:hypothetical protein
MLKYHDKQNGNCIDPFSTAFDNPAIFTSEFLNFTKYGVYMPFGNHC